MLHLAGQGPRTHLACIMRLPELCDLNETDAKPPVSNTKNTSALSPEAMRALAEAAARRAKAGAQPLQPEINGRGGLEPVRYGDWEVKGLTIDF